MQTVEISIDSPKRNRKLSQFTVSSKFTLLTQSTLDDESLLQSRNKRKISHDYKNIDFNQSNNQEIKFIEAKCNFKLSTQVLSFQMEEQRNHQLKIINSNPQLFSYYNCLKKLFMMLYQASIPLRENRYHVTPQTLAMNNLQILSIIFGQDSNKFSTEYLRSLQFFAENMSYLSNTSLQFQRRIEHVALKSCLHNQKRHHIENAFLNTKIEAHWKKIEEQFSHLEIYSYIQDQFQKAQQKLCFIEIQQFVKNKLSSQIFGKMLKKYCQFQQIDDDMNFSFKFQFFLAEQLCFNTLNDLFKEQIKQQNGVCQIM